MSPRSATRSPSSPMTMQRRIAAALPAAATIVVLAPRHGRGPRHAQRLAVLLSPAILRCRWSWSATSRRRPWRAPPSSAAAGSTRRRSASRSPTSTPSSSGSSASSPASCRKAIAERFALDPAAAALIPVGAGAFPDTAGIPRHRPGHRRARARRDGGGRGARRRVQGAGARPSAPPISPTASGSSALASRAFHAGEIDLARELATRARNVARDTGGGGHRRSRPPGDTPLSAPLHGDFRDAGALAPRAGTASRRACNGAAPRGTRARRADRRAGRA